jgi:hypothetical protein
MLPFEERNQFRLYLEKAQQTSKPIQIEHDIFRSDGSRTHLKGWLSIVQNDSGENEFAMLYRQVENASNEMEQISENLYFPVLKRAYDSIFELNMETAMTECIHVQDKSVMDSFFGVKMTTESAKFFYLNNYIFSEDRPIMTEFLNHITDPNDDWNKESVIQADFRIKMQDNIYQCLGVAVHLDEKRVLLCCRNITNQTRYSTQNMKSKTLHTLYEWMDYLSVNNKEGIVGMLMLDENPKGCSLLYGSASVLHYLGLDSEDSTHRSTKPSLEECLAAADLTKSEFDELVSGKNLYLWSRSVPDAYQFQLICKKYSRGNRNLYIIWCKKDVQINTDTTSKRIFARTFGHFDLFLDNVPINFSSSKEKELMALLIDRNGGTLSPTDAISYLWEDEPADERTSARYRKLAMGLKRTLKNMVLRTLLSTTTVSAVLTPLPYVATTMSCLPVTSSIGRHSTTPI